jgi:hypothetical protein
MRTNPLVIAFAVSSPIRLPIPGSGASDRETAMRPAIDFLPTIS